MNSDIQGDSNSSLAAYPSGCTLQGEPSVTQNPSQVTSCTVMATRVEWTATLATCTGQRKWAPEAQEKNPENLGIEPRLG